MKIVQILPALLLSTIMSHGGGIYWTNRGAGLLERSLYDGTGRATVLASAGTNVRGIWLDLPSNRIWYCDNGLDIIYKLTLDGSGRTTVLTLGTGTSFPADLELNLSAGHLYYCDQQKAHIRRTNLDGTSAITLVTDTVYQPYYLDLDLVNGKIYWGDFDGATTATGNIFRMNLDGSGRTTVVTENQQTRAVCVDPDGGRLYWVNRNAGKVMRCKLADLPVSATDATKVQTLYANLDTPHGMVLDVPAGKLYWVDTATNGYPNTLGDRAVSRGDMDGSGPHEVLVELINSEPWDVDVDPRVASYAEWVARFFSKNPGGAAAAMEDPDLDGVNNLLECALGMQPRQSDVARLPVSVVLAVEGNSFPGLRFLRRTGVAKLSVLPQHSFDMGFWWDENSPGAGPPRLTQVSVVPKAENLEEVTVRSVFPLQQHPRQFLKVAAILAP